MQTGIYPLVIVHMHFDLFAWPQLSSIRGPIPFEIGLDHVVGLAGGNALGELTIVIGILFPVWFLLVFAADLDLDPVNRQIIRPPDRAKNQRVGLLMLFLSWRGILRSRENPAGAQEGKEQRESSGTAGSWRKAAGQKLGVQE